MILIYFLVSNENTQTHFVKNCRIFNIRAGIIYKGKFKAVTCHEGAERK